jgi:hypothetical protein
MTQKINKILINIILRDVIEKESSNKKEIKTKINRNQKYKDQI